jgi:hypothetical protein
MKKIIFLLLIVITFSCEEVVDIPLDTAPPRLVVEADILWRKNTTGQAQQIKLTLTTGFYDAVVPPATGANVQIVNGNNQVFTFVEEVGTGIYKCDNFVPAINQDYTLQIVYNGQSYSATEKLLASPAVGNVLQETVGGFSGDVFQLTFFYPDNVNETNYYLHKFTSSNKPLPRLFANRDEFFNGNMMFGIYRDPDLEIGQAVKFSLISITAKDYAFMRQFISLSATAGGNPFNPPAGILKGNVKNTTVEANFPLGYFRLSEWDEKVHVVQ